MILDFIRDNLDGDAWEKWCDACYRDRYQQYNFLKIPAAHLGDAGIEGFTNNGIVYQCYCPEKSYSDNELYEHLRNKVTRDIAKLIDIENGKRLVGLGIRQIREWHFVVPEYRDKRILEHLEAKRQEIVDAITNNSEGLSYISPEIEVTIKTAEDFKVELVRLIRDPHVDIKINAAVKSIGPVDWTTCETAKIENIKRKLRAIMASDDDDDIFKSMLAFWAESYLKGIEVMSALQSSCGTIYEELLDLEQHYKKEVSFRSSMNKDCSLNYSIFMGILDNFERTLEEQFTCFSKPSIMELKHDLVSGWLADCSLQFKAG